MRESINNERAADIRDVIIKTAKPGRPADTKRQANDYLYEGYKIHETFDPDGPSFSECIVRVFS